VIGEGCVDAAYQVHALTLGGSIVRPSNLWCLSLEIGRSGTVSGVVNPYGVVWDVFGFEREPDAFGVGAPSVSFSEQNRSG